LKYQQISIESVTRRIKALEKSFKNALETSAEDDEDLNEDEKMMKQELKKRKSEILKLLNSQTIG